MSERLHALNQNRRRAADYTLEFRTHTVESGWNDSALCAVYRNRLNDKNSQGTGMSRRICISDTLIHMSITLDNLLKERVPLSKVIDKTTPSKAQSYPVSKPERDSETESKPTQEFLEPMEHGTSERNHCCKITQQREITPRNTLLVIVTKIIACAPISLPVQIHHSDQIYSLSAMIDSGLAAEKLPDLPPCSE